MIMDHLCQIHFFIRNHPWSSMIVIIPLAPIVFNYIYLWLILSLFMIIDA